MTTEVKSESAKKNEDWMNSKWRPMMGWSYMLTCVADFVIFPVLWSIVQVIGGGEVKTQWQPITLQGAGLYHIAMGAVLGIAAYGRTQEKLGDKAGATMPTPSIPTSAPAPSMPPSTPAPSFGSTTAAPAVKPAPAFGAPVQPPHPEI
jgi:hypothetical protein